MNYWQNNKSGDLVLEHRKQELPTSDRFIVGTLRRAEGDCGF